VQAAGERGRIVAALLGGNICEEDERFI